MKYKIDIYDRKNHISLGTYYFESFPLIDHKILIREGIIKVVDIVHYARRDKNQHDSCCILHVEL